MPDLSPGAAQWQWLFNVYAIIGTVVGTVVIGWLVHNVLRYRSRRGREEPEDAPAPGRVPPERGTVRAPAALAVVVAGILFALTLGTLQTVDLIEHPPDAGNALHIEVHGFQWGWRFVYPNGREVIGDLRVPKDRVVVFNVTGDDVFHAFGLPDFRVKSDAIPGKVNHIWIRASETGTFAILCYEHCGIGHARMTGRLLVLEPGDFDQWYGGP